MTDCESLFDRMPEAFAYFCVFNSLDYAKLDDKALKTTRTKFNVNMDTYCRIFAENESQIPEEFLRLLAEVLPNLPTSFADIQVENNKKLLPDWVHDLRIILRRVFMDKGFNSCGDAMRCTMFSIASFLFIRFDFDWISPDSQLLELLVRLAKIELNLSLMDCENQQNRPLEDTLPCLVIMQKTVEHILSTCDGQDPPPTNDKQLMQHSLINKLHEVVLDCVKLTLQYLVEIGKLGRTSLLDETVILAIFRLLCTYLAEGFELIDENLIKQCLPFLVSVLKKDLEDKKGDFLEYFARFAQALCEQNSWLNCIIKDASLADILQTYEPKDTNRIEAKYILLSLFDKHLS